LANYKLTSLQVGHQAESLACDYLQQCGLRLLRRNYLAPCGELDLIMQDHDHMVFVEVRFRRNHRYGSGADSVTATKQDKLIKTALYYLQQHPKQAKHPVRFDVISISATEGQMDVEWIKDAFQAEG
jgi:putative endonuclease